MTQQPRLEPLVGQQRISGQRIALGGRSGSRGKGQHLLAADHLAAAGRHVVQRHLVIGQEKSATPSARKKGWMSRMKASQAVIMQPIWP